MFTGIIQDQVQIIKRQAAQGQVRLTLRPRKRARLKLGDSVAINGVCLTVSGLNGRTFQADIVRETLAATHLGALQRGDYANFEPSLKYGDRIGGHFVTGHVDGCGNLKHIEKKKKNIWLSVRVPRLIIRFIAVKGSVALDGVSLTVQKIKGSTLTVAIIPHTYRVTTLGQKKIGDPVHIEVDQTMRYLIRLIGRQSKKTPAGLKLAPLRRQGF